MGLTAYLVPTQTEKSRNVHLFWNGTRGNLAVSIKSSRSLSEDASTVYAAADTAREGIIVPTSHLDSTVVDCMRIVIGVTYPPLPKGKTYEDVENFDVSIVSPFYQQVATLPKNINSVAAASDKTNAWVFFLTGGDDKGSRLVAKNLTTFSKNNLPANAPPAAKKTYLAAYYNGVKGTAYCYYQTTGKYNFIQQFDVKGSTVTEITKTENLSDESTTIFTVAWVEKTKKSYLYYVDKFSKLQRLSLLIDSKEDNHSWSAPKQIEEVEIPADSQLSVVPSEENKLNNVFFHNENGTFTHVVDEWD